MPRYLIQIRYDGTNFSGWQKQPGDTKTIQCELERVLTLILREPVDLVASGRTDAGVHAECQFAHFDLSRSISSVVDLLHKCNRILDRSIYADDLKEVPENFHARFDAVSRTYRYQFATRRDVFNERYTWVIDDQSNLDWMKIAARKLIGSHDFASYSKYNPDLTCTLCSVLQSEFVVTSENSFFFEIQANRFLHHMVRTIVVRWWL
jgi:tRNA pseudouridine38-40 synthase